MTDSSWVNRIQELRQRLSSTEPEADRNVLLSVASDLLAIADQLDTQARSLADSEQRYRSIFEHSADGLVLVDEEGRVIEWNHVQEEITGRAREQVIGRLLWDVQMEMVPEQRRALVSVDDARDYIRQVLRTGQTLNQVHEWEWTIQRSDGSLRTVHVRQTPVHTRAGYFVVAAVRDITEQKEAEGVLRRRNDELVALNAELRARNEELDAFAHTVAHDLKSPLNVLVGFAESLQPSLGDMPDDQRDEAMQYIIRATHKMNNIIDELLLLAEVRKTQVETYPLDMAHILADAQQRLADLVRDRQARIERAEAWPLVLGYAPWVEEVWVNYLSNAIKYGGRPPVVCLGAEVQENGIARFWVRDNGDGVVPEVQSRLFTPFTRLDQVRARGHGLGLSIVRRIVEKMGGQVGVASSGRPGQGAEFFFTLPLA